MNFSPEMKERLSRRKYEFSKNGLIDSIYQTQKKSAMERHHTPPDYTLDDLRDWAFNQEIFHELYSSWVDSAYYTWFRPSFDRIDNNKSYSLDNLQIVTWLENHKNGVATTKKKLSIPVIAIDEIGRIYKFESLMEASIKTGINRCTIIHALKGRQKKAGGFKWEYQNKAA